MMRVAAVAISLSFAAVSTSAQETITRGENLSVDVASDGRVALGLAGDIWIVPAGGGDASAVTKGGSSASRPRWSPDSLSIAYQSNADGGQGIWVYDLGEDRARKLSADGSFDVQPDWHPDQERLVYARDMSGAGFDLWEVDLPTGLHWRLTDRPGDETEPAWSADGRDLVYVHLHEGRWSMVLRRHGQPEQTLVSTTDRLSAPSWRPDGSLITYLREVPGNASLEMVILSVPPLIRTYSDGEKLDRSPVSWLDRDRMIYAADGSIRQRLFNSWSSSPVLFRATLQASAAAETIERQQLASIDEPPGRLIVHAARLYDGLGSSYESNRDIVIDGGRVAAVEPHRERTGDVVINMGDLVVLPGFIDAQASMQSVTDDRYGALLLTTGMTTVVAETNDGERLNALWSGKELPGPRLLLDDGRLGGGIGALADSTTPGLPELLQSRQAALIALPEPVPRRFAEPPSIQTGSTTMVVSSRGNGLPPGLALHAELRALTSAGLKPGQALRAAGVNAAAALGVDPFLGRIAVGAVADLLFVDGDPLRDITDALNIVAVVRNGRFYSVSGLIERAGSSLSVE